MNQRLDFIGMNDFNPDTKIFNSSVFKFKPEHEVKIMAAFIDDRIKWLRYSGGQNVISDLIKGFRNEVIS